MRYREKEYDIPVCPSEMHPERYGVKISLPGGITPPQISYEQMGFRLGEEGKEIGFKGRFYHALNLVRMIWPGGLKSEVAIEASYTAPRKTKSIRIQNNYFLDALKGLCESDMQVHPDYGPYPDAVGLTGCASSGKTFSTAVYLLLCFYSSPDKFTGIISTTSGSSADRRIWGDVKKLHDASIFGVREEFQVIEYLKSIVYMPGSNELSGKAKLRDLRNAICVVPIARGREGEPSLAAIMGMKNEFVCWAIDELPAMDDNVMRPRSNLEANERFQFIGIGNASRKSDPHGLLLEPVDGWDTIDSGTDKWFAKTCVAYFFHGAASPNFHPAVSDKHRLKKKLPFPYLSNRISMDSIAIANSSVREIEMGRKTLDYLRFAEGFWPGEDALNTVLSAGFVRTTESDHTEVLWGHEPLVKVGAFDPSFTASGDNSEIAVGTLGKTTHGRYVFLLPDDTVTINPPIRHNDETYRQVSAQEVVAYMRNNGVSPENFFMDGGGDGGLMVQEVMKAWLKYDPAAAGINVLSSVAKLTDKTRYNDRVTKYWYRMVDAMRSASIKGFNIRSKYAREFFERRYEAMGDRKVKLESKRDMRKRVHYSPDSADTMAYLLHGAIARGLNIFDPEREVMEESERHSVRRFAISDASSTNPYVPSMAESGYGI